MGKVVLDDDDEIISNPEMIFTDRDNPRKVFWDAYDGLHNDEFYVINYHGFGGIGKSWLCRYLCNAIRSGVHPGSGATLHSKALILNFEDLKNNCDQVAVTESLANKLEGECNFSFPLFKYGLYVYYRTKGYSAESPEIKKIQDNAIGATVFDAVGMIPVVGGIGSLLLKGVDSLNAVLKEQVVKNSEYIKKLDLLSSEDVATEIVKIFAKELREQTAKEQGPLVIFMDTYEQMQNYVYQTASAKVSEEWLWSRTGLIRRIPNVLWVFAGQRKLSWGKEDPFWNSEENVAYEEILEIKDGDLLKKMLTDIGIKEPAIVDIIVEKTGGVPVHLALCKDIYFNMKRDGREPRVEDFDMGYTQLATRFIGGLNSEMKDIVNMLACLETWTEKDIEQLQISPDAYEYILQLSFISQDVGFCYMHHSVQEIVSRECPNIISNRIRNYIEEGLKDATATDDSKQDSISRMLKLELGSISAETDPQAREEQIRKLEETLRPYIEQYGTDAGFFKRVRDAVEAAVAEEELSPEFRKELDVYTVYHYALNGEVTRIRSFVESKHVMVGHLKLPANLRSFLYYSMSRYENSQQNYSEARNYLLEALQLWDKENHFGEYLDALQTLGRICINRESYEEAEHYSDRGIAEFEERKLTSVDSTTAVSLCELWTNKAKVERYRGNTSKALEYLARAEEILKPYRELENVGVLFEYSVIYQQYCFNYRTVGRKELRKEYAEKCLKLAEQCYELDATDRNLRSLAIAHEDAGKASYSYAECKEHFDKAIAIYEQIYQAQHTSKAYTEYFREIRTAADEVSRKEAPAYLKKCHELLEEKSDCTISWKERYSFYQSEVSYYYIDDEYDTVFEKLRELDKILEDQKGKLSEEDYLEYVSWSMRQYGITYDRRNDIYEALRYLKKENAVELRMYKNFLTHSHGRGYSDSCRMLAKMYNKKQMYAQALIFARKQIEIEKALVDEYHGAPRIRKLIEAYKVLEEVYEFQHDTENVVATLELRYQYAKELCEISRNEDDLFEVLLAVLHLEKHYIQSGKQEELVRRYRELLKEYQSILDSGKVDDPRQIEKYTDYIQCSLGRISYLFGGDLEKARQDMIKSSCPFSQFTERDQEFYVNKIETKLTGKTLQVIRPDAAMKKAILEGNW
jgi:tetratricopeptide (TPR) repeat protein